MSNYAPQCSFGFDQTHYKVSVSFLTWLNTKTDPLPQKVLFNWLNETNVVLIIRQSKILFTTRNDSLDQKRKIIVINFMCT